MKLGNFSEDELRQKERQTAREMAKLKRKGKANSLHLKQRQGAIRKSLGHVLDTYPDNNLGSQTAPNAFAINFEVPEVHEPGTFLPVLPQVAFAKAPEKLKIEPKIAEDLVESYRVFQEGVGKTDFGVVYHPCCSYDVSPSAAFPNSRVIYADRDKEAMKALIDFGYEAHEEDVLKFDPHTDVDVLILLNPAISGQKVAEKVAVGGYVLCNDYHGTATELKTNSNFELVGMIRGKKDGKFFDKENLEDYWKEIETDEEFQNAPLSWGAVDYRTAAQVVKTVTGETTNILQHYKELIVRGKEQTRIKNQEFALTLPPEMADLDLGTDDETTFLEHGGQSMVLDARLPSKKGHVDDIFVYEKIKV